MWTSHKGENAGAFREEKKKPTASRSCHAAKVMSSSFAKHLVRFLNSTQTLLTFFEKPTTVPSSPGAQILASIRVQHHLLPMGRPTLA